MEAGQTHQLLEEGSFLVLLRIALILVQAILQLQCERVIVGSYYLQHLREVKGQAGLRPFEPEVTWSPGPLLLPCWVGFNLGQRLQETMLTPYHTEKSLAQSNFSGFWDHFLIYSIPGFS